MNEVNPEQQQAPQPIETREPATPRGGEKRMSAEDDLLYFDLMYKQMDFSNPTDGSIRLTRSLMEKYPTLERDVVRRITGFHLRNSDEEPAKNDADAYEKGLKIYERAVETAKKFGIDEKAVREDARFRFYDRKD